jgi:hypothetical protein
MSRFSLLSVVGGCLLILALGVGVNAGVSSHDDVVIVADDDAAQVKGAACCWPFGYWNPPYYSDCGGPTKNAQQKCEDAAVHFWCGNPAESWSTEDCLQCGNKCGSYRVSNGCG